jgi:DNA-binding GntR family transcriptional regulator
VPDKLINQPKKKLGMQAREKLENYIETGVLRPDQRLIEADLASRLGLSRTPLREALHQLEIKGYVTKSPTSGYVVTYHTNKDIEEIFEAREALETRALQLACERISQEQIDRALEYLYHEKKSFNSISAMWHWNNLFHDEMYGACGNKLLFSMIQSIRDKDRVINMSRVFKESDLPLIHEQHQRILDAVRQGDKRRAVIAVRRHLRMLLEIYLR